MSDRYKGAILSPTAPTVTPQSAGGIYTSSQQLQYQGQGVWPSAVNYPINNSLRFRSSASAYLNRTQGTSTNQLIGTWSLWFKRGALGSTQRLLEGYTASSDTGVGALEFGSDNKLYFFGWATNWRVTTQVFRDPSAWYHIVLTVDTTQSTPSNRVRLYVNGSEITAFDTSNNPTQNNTFGLNNNSAVLQIGRRRNVSNNDNFFDGYMTEVNFIDGQALTPSSFGTTDAYGIWQPIPYTGAYGNNGFYLPFRPANASFAGSFNGTNQLISVAANSAFNFTGDFTAECWYYTSTVTNTSQPTLFTIGSDASGLVVGFFSGTFYCYMLGSGALMTAATPPLNQWVHVAWVRVGSTNTLYLNGVATATATVSGTLSSTGGVTVGRTGSSGTSFGYFQGSVSNFRLNNTAVYTANFTPSTSPLTAISGTQLLTLQNATIVDNSTNAFSITNTNSVTMSSANPFNFSVSLDYSGNGNNWTPNNISLVSGSTYDSMTDVPTNTNSNTANYCVLNPLDNAGGGTVSDGNLKLVSSGSTWRIQPATMAVSRGKYYFEAVQTGYAGASVFACGLVPVPTPSLDYLNLPSSVSGSSGWSFQLDSASTLYFWYAYSGSAQYITISTSFNIGDVAQIAFDLDAGTIWVGKNNTWYNSTGGTTGNPAAGTNPTATNLSGQVTPFLGAYGSTAYGAINFGQQPFTYTPPSGFYPLNTYNLPTPTILDGDQYFNATTYSGNNGTQSVTNSGSMQPDFVWVKNRTNAYTHLLYDSVRGVGTLKAMSSSETTAEGGMSDNSTFGYLSALNSNGFTVVSGSTANSYTNSSSNNYIGWQWRAGQGTTSSNTNGTITSTVSVNTTSGFSIVTYTGNGSNSTIGHGLGVAPSFIIAKARNSAQRWTVYTGALGNGYYGYLNETFAFDTANASLRWNTAPTSSVFGVGTSVDVNGNTTTYVAYCFSQVAGYSAFGSYTGNGSSDGPFVYTGFRPRFLIVKRTNDIGSWIMTDSARSTYNVTGELFNANTSGAEFTTSDIKFDYLSNGFKLREVNGAINASGSSYIYMAFAENPFKIARGR